MNIIFLDIDGVLNSVQHAIMCCRNGIIPYRHSFCPICTSNLLYIVENCNNVKIVISSIWRLIYPMDQLKEIFENQGIGPDIIIDVTPYNQGEDRGSEIKSWLTTNKQKVSNFVILDDDSDMGSLVDALFQTDFKIGLDLITANKIIKTFQCKKKK